MAAKVILLVVSVVLAAFWVGDGAVLGADADVTAPLEGESLQLTNIKNHLPNLRLSLTDDNGQAVSERTYRGKIVLLYFGFTRCPDECPLTMARLAKIFAGLGDAANNIRVLFVSVNPENDTPEVLHHYLAAYDTKHMSGLTGSAREIELLAQRYRAAYRAAPDDDGDFQHSNVIYIFDEEGRARLLALPDDADEKVAHDLRVLSNGG